MRSLRILLPLLILALVGGVIWYYSTRRSGAIVLSGVVTTDEVIVSSEIQGRLQQVLVKEGDLVKGQQLLAVVDPAIEQADSEFYANSQQQYDALVKQAEADLENTRLTLQRDEPLFKEHALSGQDYDQARFSYQATQMRVESLKRQAKASAAQLDKAAVQLSHTRIVAPVDGIVDTRVALRGEVVNPAQPIVTLINPDDLWVRADVEETYIDQVLLGQVLQVRLPSGAVRQGTVFYRRVDADYATQRDVSRTKRDIRTFEVRLRCDNRDRALAVGMTAYVTLPVGGQ